nr:GntR family transcriptional regulator [Gluconacetobacter azotocaptans]
MNARRPCVSTYAEDIYNNLAEQILHGKLRPGQRLDEQSLAATFNVSRTPVREALKELATRGLIDFVPRRGAIVTQISLDQLADMLDAECEIEALCARLASQKMNALEKSMLQGLYEQGKDAAQRGDQTAYWAINRSFHELIGRGAHNETLAGLMQDLRTRLAPFRQAQPLAHGERLNRSRDDHGAVVRAIVAGDPEAAYTVMRDHNARLAAGVLQLLRSHHDSQARQPEFMPTP